MTGATINTETGVSPRTACAIAAAVTGFVALAAIVALNVGALPSLPVTLVLGVSIPVLYGASLGALPRGAEERWAAVTMDEIENRSEAGRVRALRHRRLVALGVAEEIALLLAGHPSFSVNELKRLLGKGCPLDTALRILWPLTPDPQVDRSAGWLAGARCGYS